MLLVDGVTIEVGGGHALEGLDLAVGDREVVGLIGPSGAGKSTLLDAVSGVRRPREGRIVVGRDGNEREITGLAPHRIASLGVARTFQSPALFPGLGVRENVDLGRKVKVRSSVLAAARCWRAAQREDARQRDVVARILRFLELEDVGDTPVGALPCGLRKRVELGRALAIEPHLLLLDDLTTGMTICEKDETLHVLRRVHEQLGIAILFASHDIGVTTELCTRVVALHEGRKIAEGPAACIRQNHKVMSAYLGRSVDDDLDPDLVRD